MMKNDKKALIEKILPEDLSEAKELSRVHIPTYQAIISAQLAAVTAVLLDKGITTNEEFLEMMRACYSEIRKQTIKELEGDGESNNAI